MNPLSDENLENEMQQLLDHGEDPFSVALFGITNHYLLSAQAKTDHAFSKFLEELDMDVFSPADYEAEEAPYMELLACYYLIAQNVKSFALNAKWLYHLNEGQRKIVLSWPKRYILSVFDVKVQEDQVIYQDMRTGKDYLATALPKNWEYQQFNRNLRRITILVPTDQNYLSVIPVFIPMDEFNFEKMKRLKGKRAYERALLIRSSNHLSALFEQNRWDKEWDIKDYFNEKSHGFVPAVKGSVETEERFARRLLQQSYFFKNFQHFEQAEKLMLKIIQTFPQLFFAYSNATALLEGMEMIFTMRSFSRLDIETMSDELSFFWYLLIKEHLSKEIEELSAYISTYEEDK